MIRYSLRCNEGHVFEGWFRSSDVFETQRGAGQISCTFCGSDQVEKALMAPAVPRKAAQRKHSLAEPTPDQAAEAPQSQSREEAISRALTKLRAHIETNSDYVGTGFADEARAMHEGRSPSRAIHGEARPEDARALIEDGVPVAALPFIPRQKTN